MEENSIYLVLGVGGKVFTTVDVIAALDL